MKPQVELPASLIEKYDISPLQQEQLLNYLNRVIEVNKKTNLTRIDTLEQGILLHIEDSLLGLPYLNASLAGVYADLGSGGGFPGVPLAIMTHRTTTLVDSVKKKMAAVADICASLCLDMIETSSLRIEDLASEKPEQFAVCSARALSSLPSLLELVSPLLLQKGHFICYKAKIEEEELNQARMLEQKLAMKLILDDFFVLSDNETPRTILVFEKSGYPEVKLPRRVGMAQKKPYKY